MNDINQGIIPTLPSFHENKIQTTELVITNPQHTSNTYDMGYNNFLSQWTRERHIQRNKNAADAFDPYVRGLKDYLIVQPGMLKTIPSSVQSSAQASEALCFDTKALSTLSKLDQTMYRAAFSCYRASMTPQFKDYLKAALAVTNDHLHELKPISHKRKLSHQNKI